MKTCSRCGEAKPADDFHRDRRAKDGRSYHCKECAKSRARNWAEANRERSRQKSAEWYAANRQYVSDRDRAKYAEDPAKHRQAALDYYYRNRDKVLASQELRPHIRWEAVHRTRCKALGLTPTVTPFTVDQLVERRGPGCAVHLCQYAGDPLELDHIWPVALGGEHSLRNCQRLCVTHHRMKSNMDLKIVAAYRQRAMLPIRKALASA
ncbi:HNH endonuclease [Gordonia phage SpeedDemon]|nr:HNH endonuclease [Gordonia phage SpeedDemon]